MTMNIMRLAVTVFAAATLAAADRLAGRRPVPAAASVSAPTWGPRYPVRAGRWS